MQEQSLELEKQRTQLEKLRSELQTTTASLERLRAISPDSNITDYMPAVG